MLTQIQRDAMTRAQAGDFSLVDAIELLHDDRATFRDEMLVGGVTQGNRLRYLVYGDEALCKECEDGTEACAECDGDGSTECESCGHIAKCDDCHGTGRVKCSHCSGTEVPDSAAFYGEGWRYVVTLNGDIVFHDPDGDSSDTPPPRDYAETAPGARDHRGLRNRAGGRGECGRHPRASHLRGH